MVIRRLENVCVNTLRVFPESQYVSGEASYEVPERTAVVCCGTVIHSSKQPVTVSDSTMVNGVGVRRSVMRFS